MEATILTWHCLQDSFNSVDRDFSRHSTDRWDIFGVYESCDRVSPLYKLAFYIKTFNANSLSSYFSTTCKDLRVVVRFGGGLLSCVSIAISQYKSDREVGFAFNRGVRIPKTLIN